MFVAIRLPGQKSLGEPRVEGGSSRAARQRDETVYVAAPQTAAFGRKAAASRSLVGPGRSPACSWMQEPALSVSFGSRASAFGR